MRQDSLKATRNHNDDRRNGKMSEENTNPENIESEAAQGEVLPSSEDPEAIIAAKLEAAQVERLPDEQIAELEKLNQEIVYVEIDDIRPSPNKERRNDDAIPKVASSIRQCGFRSPIFVNGETNEIVIGHTRWFAAKKLGLHRVPVVYIFDLSPSKLKLLKLADNKVAEFSGWDFGELNKTLGELKLELPDFDLGGLGFDGGDATVDPDDFFDDDNGEAKEKEPKKITVTCPDCGKTFEVEA